MIDMSSSDIDDIGDDRRPDLHCRPKKSDSNIDMCLDDFFEVYNVTEKDKAELLSRLTECYKKQSEVISRLKIEIKKVWGHMAFAVISNYHEKELLRHSVMSSKEALKDIIPQ